MVGFPLKSWVRFLLLLLTLFFLLAAPSFQDSLPLQGLGIPAIVLNVAIKTANVFPFFPGKLSLPSIKTESLSSVNKRGGGSRGGGGGSRGGGWRSSSSGKGGGGMKGKGTSGRGRAIPVYAGGAAAAAGAHGRHRNGAVLINPGKANLGLSMLVLAITLFKYFLAC